LYQRATSSSPRAIRFTSTRFIFLFHAAIDRRVFS
jgi:hypothetical protein